MWLRRRRRAGPHLQPIIRGNRRQFAVCGRAPRTPGGVGALTGLGSVTDRNALWQTRTGVQGIQIFYIKFVLKAVTRECIGAP